MSTNLEVKKLQDYYFSQYRTIGNELYWFYSIILLWNI
jgi:hypothetical protein